MEYTVKSGNPEKQRIGCVVIPVFASRKLSSSAKIIDNAYLIVLNGSFAVKPLFVSSPSGATYRSASA